MIFEDALEWDPTTAGITSPPEVLVDRVVHEARRLVSRGDEGPMSLPRSPIPPGLLAAVRDLEKWLARHK